MSLQAAQLADLVAATLNDLGEMKITEITSDLQRHVAMRQLMRQNRIVLDAGPAIQWDLMTTHSGSARTVGLYATDIVNVGEVLTQASMPWRHTTANYAFDEREMAMNRSPRRIVDLLKIRRYDCMVSQAELFENLFWRCPASDNVLDPHGVPYWITKNNTTGFNGGAYSGYTTVATLSPTTYPRWQNWTAQYTSVSKDDLVRKWREAAVKTDFEPPVDGMATFNTGDRYGFFTNYAVIGALEEELEAQNDNLGNQVNSKDGKVTFSSVPVTYVPKLDADTTDPVYGINWGVFKTYILRGFWMRETKISVTPGQHTVVSVHTDNSLNWICKDRRRNFVLAKDTTYPA